MSDTQPTILIVEDEALIAMDIADAFEEAGWTVVGPCGSIAKAEEALEATTPDAALLDMNLSGKSSITLAERLVRDEVYVAFLTGDQPDDLPEILSDTKIHSKPASNDAVISAFWAEVSG